MLFSALSSKENMLLFLLSLPTFLIALSVHEAMHGYVAYWQGDPTAKNFGRLSLNPLKHFDLVGFLAMMLCGFGWAKPVPINTRNFRNPRRGMALTALAGPVSNLILSYLGYILMIAVYGISCHVSEIPAALYAAYPKITYGDIFYHCMLNVESLRLLSIIGLFFWLFSYYNLMLGLFNLLPIPPFDGSRIAGLLLPQKYYFRIMKYERTIMIVVLVLLAIGIIQLPLDFLITKCMQFFRFTLSWLPFV